MARLRLLAGALGAVLLVVLFAGLLQLNAALGRIEVVGQPSTTAISLFALSPAKASENARTAWCVWHHFAAPEQHSGQPGAQPEPGPTQSGVGVDPQTATQSCLAALRGETGAIVPAPAGEASRLLRSFVVVGTVLEVGAALFVAWLLRRLRRALGDEPVDAALAVATQRSFLFSVVGVFAAFDIVANAAIGVLADGNASPGTVNGWAPVIWVFTALAWATAGVLILLTAVLAVRWLRPHWRSVRLACNQLRVPIAVLAVYGLILSGLGTDQVQDALLANAYRPWLLVFTVLAAVVLTLQVWRSPLRTLSTAEAVGDPIPPWLPTVVCLAAVAAGLWWRNLWGLAAAAGLLVVLSTLVGAFPWRRSERTKAGAEAGNPDRLEPGDYAVVLRAVHRLAALPLALLGLYMVRSGTVTMLLEPDQYEVTVFVVVGLVVAAASVGVPSALEALEGRFRWAAASYDFRRHWLNLGVFAVNAGVAIAVYVDPYGVPVVVGPIAMVLFFLGLVLAVLGELQRWAQRSSPVAGLRLLGFRRTPVLLLLTVWFVVGSIADTGGHNAARTIAAPGQVAQAQTLQHYFERWAAANCATTGTASDTPVTMAFVAASGGGIRAAYWTAGALEQLFPADRPRCQDDRESVFAVSGASGGSVGALSWIVHDPADVSAWYKDAFGDDYLSSALSWLLYVDIPRGMVGFPGQDRAAVLETAMEHSQPAFAQPFLGTYGHDGDGWVPLALLNGTAAETGCRALVAPVQLGGFDAPGSVATCRAHPDELPPGSEHGQAGVTMVDVAGGYICTGTDIRRSTAAVLSARFPYVTPSGSFPQCDGDGRVSVVDGGYVDNTGALTAVDLFAQVKPYIDCHNAAYQKVDPLPEGCAALRAGMAAPTRPIAPVFVHIDNGYESVAQAPTLSRPHELLLPPLGYLKAAGTTDAGAQQRAFVALGCPPMSGSPTGRTRVSRRPSAGPCRRRPRTTSTCSSNRSGHWPA